MVKAELPAAEEDEQDTDKESAEPELEAVNSAKALWTRSRSEVDDEEYKEFYKHVSHDFEEPQEPQQSRGQTGIHQFAVSA